MYKLRFWQKTYLLTLTLFLVALFGGVAFMGWQNQQQAMGRETQSTRSEQQFIAQSLARDLTAINTGNVRLHASSLARSYGEQYAQDGALLEVRQGDEVLFSNIPTPSESEEILAIEQGKQTWMARELADDKRYLVVASALPAANENYTLTYARSLEPLLATWEDMRFTLVAGCLVTSVVLAVGLFFILRSLAKPLEALAGVANTFARGDFSARATKRSDDEIGALAGSFNAMADTAERNIAEISHIADQNARMAANLSHEIRTPLTAIRGYAEYLQLADPTPDESASALTYIVDESARLQAISQRMLHLFALEHEQLTFDAVALNDVIEQARRSVQPTAQNADVEIRCDISPSIHVLGDEVLLESLFTNLLANAIHACEPGGHVSVSATTSDTTTTLRITDDGCGLSPSELARLGEPFYRPDKARSRTSGGAGLGVALSFHIAQLHQATLSYTSKPQTGTTATLEFTTL